MDIWFTSDLHIGHSNGKIIDYCPARGELWQGEDRLDQMNHDLIENYNALVKPGDIVYFGGDIVMGKRLETIPLAGKLNGTKVAIPGNHDDFAWYNQPGKRSQVWSDAGFSFLSNNGDDEGISDFTPLFTDTTFRPVEFCHFPFEGDSHGEDRYQHLRPVNYGQWLICGHVHDAWKVHGRQINIGVDVWDFKPVHIDQIKAIMAEKGDD